MPKLTYHKRGGKGLSYSRCCLLHLCPRKFQLSEIIGLHKHEENIDFDFGHAVAAGIQHLVAAPTELNRAIAIAVSSWNSSIFNEDYPDRKSLWFAVRAVQKFQELQKTKPFFREYEIAKFRNKNGELKPAIELTFKIDCYDDYVYEGHIDLVLVHKQTRTHLIVEVKTTVFTNLHEAMYKNSAQALGYSVVLDAIAKYERELTGVEVSSSYHVMYLIYKAKKFEYVDMFFPKSNLQRAQFVNGLILDIEQASMYANYDFYPTHGESCYNFFRPCEFFELCGYSNEALKKLAHTQEQGIIASDRYTELGEDEFDFIFSLEEIRKQQLGELS